MHICHICPIYVYKGYAPLMHMQAQKPSFIPRPLCRNESGFQSLMPLYVCHICFHVYMSLSYLYIWPICRHAKIIQTCICVYSTYVCIHIYHVCMYMYVGQIYISIYVPYACMQIYHACVCIYDIDVYVCITHVRMYMYEVNPCIILQSRGCPCICT